MSLVPFLHRVVDGGSLSSEQAHQAMTAVLSGAAGDAAIAAFLTALKMKGETAAEVAGFARAMREQATFVNAGEDVVDVCGTGGDGCGTFNISSIAALVMAGAGARVAKHGNRSISSQTGSADVFEALGVRIAMTPEEAAAAVREIGLGFLFAPILHPAMKHAQAVRRELKMRTIFNLLGPLVNPARAQAQLIGAPSPQSARVMAEALAELGTGRSFVVHGQDGLDEISTTNASDVYEVRTGSVEMYTWTPEDFGVARTRLEQLAGGDAAMNAHIAREILDGVPGPRLDIVVVNAAAGLVAAGLAADLKAGVAAATRSIDSGAAAQRLARLCEQYPR